MYFSATPNNKRSLSGILPVALFLISAPAAFSANVNLPLYDAFNGTVEVGTAGLAFVQGDFTVTLRPRAEATTTRFTFTSDYFFNYGLASYVYGGTHLGVSTSQVDIVRTDGGAFSFVSIEEWAFQGSLNALLGVEGFSGGALQGTEQFSFATDGGQYSFTSGLRLATTALAGKSLDKLVLLPDFTYPPTNQAGFSNLVLGDASSTIPEPGTVILLLLGTAGLATLRKKITPQA